MGVPGAIILGVLGANPACRSVWSAKNNRGLDLAARHIKLLGGGINDLVNRLHGEIKGHEFNDRLETGKRRPDPDPGKPVFGNRSVDYPLVAKFVQKPLRDLVGPLLLRHFLAHDEHVLVGAHLFGHRFV